MEVTIDFESRSPIDIKKCGGYVYWQHPLTEPMMLSVKVDDGDTRVWIAPRFRHLYATEMVDDELIAIMNDADIIIAHNAAFERNGFSYGMRRLDQRFKPIPLEKVRCTASMALMCGFPRDLDSASRYIKGVTAQKDDTGHGLMLKMSKPRSFNKEDCIPLVDDFKERGYIGKDATWKDVKAVQTAFVKKFAILGVGDEYLTDTCIVYRESAEDFRRLVEYARQDVEAERNIYKVLPHIPEYELEIYRWSETVNDRGVMVDRKGAKGIIDSVERYSSLLMSRVLELTEGEVKSMKAPLSIRAWLSKHGIDVDSIDKGSVDFLLTLDLAPEVREFLEIRQKLGRSSSAKYAALLNYSAHDGRFRGGFVYHAATTGRYGGSGPQLQNLPRPSEKNSRLLKEAHAGRQDVALLCSQDFGMIDFFWKDTMVLAADLIRPTLIPAPGKLFISADFSAVEARGLAWIAGEEKSLDGFRRGLDFYKVAASGIYRIPYEQVDGGGKGQQRQVGKTAVLACGYGGSVGAFMAFGADRMGLTEEQCADIVKAWRAANPNITKLWYDLAKASVKAIRYPNERIKVRKNISFMVVGNFLTMKLPSGRNLFYPYPKLEDCEMPWEDKDGNLAKKTMATAMTLTAAKQWVRRPLSHVTLTENLVQALCRDLLMHSCRNLEAEGYPVVMHVHDEVVCEIDEDRVTSTTLEEFESIMARIPHWAEGFPLNAEGWIGDSYRK